MREFAGGDGSLAHEVVVGAVLLDDLSGEREGIGGGHRVAGGPHAQAHGSNDAIKGTDLSADVVGAVAGDDVFVVGTAVEHDVALEFGVSGVGVVGNLVGLQDVVAIVDFGRAAQVVDGAFFFLLHGADGDGFFGVADRSRGQRWSGCGGAWRSGGAGGQRLAGYYPMSEKQMTDHGGRDKDSKAGGHQN